MGAERPQIWVKILPTTDNPVGKWTQLNKHTTLAVALRRYWQMSRLPGHTIYAVGTGYSRRNGQPWVADYKIVGYQWVRIDPLPIPGTQK